MPISVILHIANEEPIAGEIEVMPEAGDTVLIVQNPRRRDGKDLPYITSSEVTSIIWPWEKINFLEILPSEEEEEIIGFVRE
jgi:hypothetical protein